MLADLRLAFRSLRRSPVFSLAAITTLALGIAASTAIFSLFYQVLLRSLPVSSPEQLVILHYDPPQLPGNVSSDNSEVVFSNPMYRGLSDALPKAEFQGLAARGSEPAQLTGESRSARVTVELVSGNFFSVLGLHPEVGRLLVPSDDGPTPGAESVAVISHAFWLEHFGADESAVNRRIQLNGQAFTIIGVAPAEFSSLIAGRRVDFFAPIVARPLLSAGWRGLTSLNSQWLTVFGRIQPNVTRERALASLQTVWKSLLRSEIEQLDITAADRRARVMAKNLELRPATQGLNELEAQWRKPLDALLAMVGLLLLIACANVANLLVARGLARRREMAVRVAMGANRWRLLRQNLVESWLLAGVAGILGITLAVASLRALLLALPQSVLGPAIQPKLDPTVLGFSLLAVIVTSTLCGFFPALFAARADPMHALKDQVGTASGSAAHTRWRQLLVAAQLAVSLALLVGAGLFGKTLFTLLSHNPGFVADRLITFSLDARLSGLHGDVAVGIYDDVQQRLRSLPYTQSVAIAENGPLFNSRSWTNVFVEGFTPRTPEDSDCDLDGVSPGYFRTLGTPLLAGREFTPADSSEAPQVAVVNQAFVNHFLRGQTAVGKHMHRGSNTPLDVEIVGVVKDMNTDNLRDPQGPAYYMPLEQMYAAEQSIRRGSSHPPLSAFRAQFFVRSSAPRENIENDIRNIVHKIAPNVPVYNMKTMTERANDSIYAERFSALLAVLFGAVATLLAAVGLYGVVSYSVARRRQEMGIRLALGALPSQVLGLVMKEVAILTLIGIVLGIPAALLLARLSEQRVSSLDVFLAAGIVVALCGALAGFIPAYRASVVDSKEALRYE